jgi:hypothetical protein
VRKLVAADKKGGATGVRMVLLEQPGRWTVREVPESVWAPLWRSGFRP